ncbi:MAG TPA: hypothetical protein VE547_09775 [Mycobacteriales bacterium]|nr:hypothetical protein [Mycobacteriales bacterium]
MSALSVRPIGPDEVELFLSFTDASVLGLRPPRQLYLDGLGRSYRPEWSWVALRDGRVVARVAFIGPPDADRPEVMGSLEIGTGPDRVAVGTELVRTAYARVGGRPGWIQFVPVDWRDRPDCRAVVEDRTTVARAAGLTLSSERVQVLRDAGGELPAGSGRLDFRPPPDRDALLDVVARTYAGTRDAEIRRTVARDGAPAAARRRASGFGSSPELWRLAYDAGGACVGVVVPDRGGPWPPDIAYVGVLPEHRGRGHVHDLLAEGTRLLGVGTGITGAADAANTAMVAAFARAGYRVVDRLLAFGQAV